MQSGVIGQFGVKGGDQDILPLGSHCGAILELSDAFDPVSRPFNPRRSDEHPGEGILAQNGDQELGFKTVHLAAEGIAPHLDVENGQRLEVKPDNPFCQQDHAGTGAK